MRTPPSWRLEINGRVEPIRFRSRKAAREAAILARFAFSPGAHVRVIRDWPARKAVAG